MKIDGKANPADAGKKFLSSMELAEKLAVPSIDWQFDRSGCKPARPMAALRTKGGVSECSGLVLQMLS